MVEVSVAVVPILVGPLQVLLALLPAIVAAIGGLLLALLKPATAKKAAKLLWRLKYFVVATAAVVIGAVYVVGVAFPGYDRTLSKEEASAESWPIFRGSLARTGAVRGTPSPTQGGLNWAFTAEKVFHASAAVVGNRVYITSASKGVFGDSGTIYCLDADTGGLAWKSRPHGFLATFSSPAVEGKYLVSGEGLHFTRNARIVCLDVSRKGKLLWEYRTKSHVESTPCIHNGRAYIGAGDDGYYCLDLDPDAEGKAKVVWHAPGEKYPDAETPPAVADGKVFVGLGIDGNAVCCLDADDGREIWRTATPYPVFSPPAVALRSEASGSRTGGRVYVGMGNGNFIDSAEQVRTERVKKMEEQGQSRGEIDEAVKKLGPAGEVWCLDAADGGIYWRFKTARTVLGAVVADGERLYFATRGGKVHCISTGGEALAVWDAYAPILASPAVTDRYVYCVTVAGKLYALDKQSLAPVWEKALGAEGQFLSSPAIARGHVYVGSETGGFLCVGQPTGERPRSVWFGPLGGPGRSGFADAERLPERAALVWRYPPKPAEGQAEEKLSMIAPAAVLDEALLAGVSEGPRAGLLCFKPDPGARETPEVVWHFPTPNGVALSPAGDADRIFLVDGRPGQAGRYLYCIRTVTGKEAWRRPVADDASGRLVWTGRMVLIQDEPDALTCLDAEGERHWRRRVGPLAGPVHWQDLILVAAVRKPAGLVAMDLPTGEPLWQTPLAETPSAGPVVRGNRIYLPATGGLAVHRLADGGIDSRLDTGPAAGPLVGDARRLAFFNTGAEVVVIDLTSAATTAPPKQGAPRIRLRIKADGAQVEIPPLLTRDGVIYATPRGLMLREFTADRARRWMSTSLVGRATSPLIAAGSRVYFGTERRGLVCGGRWRR